MDKAMEEFANGKGYHQFQTWNHHPSKYFLLQTHTYTNTNTHTLTCWFIEGDYYLYYGH